MNSASAVTSVIIFSNDATELSFSDGSKLQLSPCGASFVCERAPSRGHHPLIEGTRIQQRTNFCTSEFKDRVHQALECRNRFAEQPFLCQQFLQADSLLHLCADIKEVEWPVSPRNVCKTSANGVQVRSIDECASLTLSSNKQEFTVEFLCRLSQKGYSQRHLEKHQTVSKNHAEDNSDAVGRQSTGFRSNQDTRHNNNKFNLPVQFDMMQDSPYLQTLNTGKACRRSSPEDILCSQGSVNERQHFAENCSGKSDDTHPLQDPLKDEVIKNVYTWVLQHHSLDQFPECWKHPLYLAWSFNLEDDLKTPKPDKKFENPSKYKSFKEREPSDKERKSLKNNSCQKSQFDMSDKNLQGPEEKHSCPLPRALPLACPASHLHNWRKDPGSRVDIVEDDIPVGERIKVWFSNGIVYRLSSTPQAGVHIYPGDGTLIKSTGTPDYFTHIIPHGSDGLDERMLSLRSPPPDHPGAAYSIAGVMRKASRLLQNVMQADFGLIPFKTKCCWKEQMPFGSVIHPSPATILEESTIKELGSFVAYSNGRVRVVFSDRTILDMIHDFSLRISGNVSDVEDNSDLPDTSNKIARIRKSIFSSDLQRGVCQLLLPNGEMKQVHLADPQKYIRYVEVAMEWAAWVASSPEQRLNFYGRQHSQMTLQDDCDVIKELQKIKCFQYILETTLPLQAKDSNTKDTTRANLEDVSSAKTVSERGGELSKEAIGQGDSEGGILASSKPDVMMPDYIREALRKTSCAIRNIDSELASS
ncbi:uncharacterized protein C5orf34 homolog isoform X2 [Asterias rubens]|uniref:uncharacterized protein C5orf34 homolog isoform X2 n=1 Tax=Asterias rubens TaxID=7604 RepID=UPI0014553A0E|nr:uncharacterized protein C5orf34 homolog isoform X2 [Asterias rubens]